jgi:hypothetical protein
MMMKKLLIEMKLEYQSYLTENKQITLKKMGQQLTMSMAQNCSVELRTK